MKSWNIIIRTSVSEEDRRAIAAFYGEKGMATLDTCRSFILHNGTGALVDAYGELDENEEDE